MKSKKTILLFSLLLVMILLGGYFVIEKLKENKENEEIKEYIPQEEISDNQVRQTIVTLYFISKEDNKLVPEARLIDIKEIINNPCDRLIELLIQGPKDDKNETILPQNTKLNKSYMENDCVILDFTEEILNYDKNKENSKENLIDSIVKTLTQLTEINKIKILINGTQAEEFNDVYGIKE